MRQIITRLLTLFLLSSCVVCVYQTAPGQSGVSPGRRPGKRSGVLPSPIIPGLAKNEDLPKRYYAEGDVGMEFKPTGEIDVKITVVGVDPVTMDYKPIPPETRSVTSTFFESGIEKWKKSSANVCGRSVSIRPNVTLDFPDNFDKPQPNQNMLYIFLGAIGLKHNDETRFSASLPRLYTPQGVERFAKLRGTGKLPPFTIYVADPWIMFNSNYQFQNNQIVSGVKVLEALAAHEFGHAMGLYDTYLAVGEKADSGGPPPTPTPVPTPTPPTDPEAIFVTTGTTREDPPGIMSALRPIPDYDFKPEYVAEIMSRTFECRVDVTATIDKTTVSPAAAASFKWDFLGKFSTKYEGAFTSQWAYFNGLSNTRNYCTTVNREGETHFKNIPFKTYQACTAKPELNNGDNVDFNLGEFTTTDGYLWEEFMVPGVTFDASFTVGEGDCKIPVSISAGDGKLPVLAPVFSFGTDGKQSWIRDVKLSVQGSARATDADPERGTDCRSSFTIKGREVNISEPSALGPIIATAPIFQDGFEVGTYKIEVKMNLVVKSAGSGAKK